MPNRRVNTDGASNGSMLKVRRCLKREAVRMPRVANWDTGLGYQLYLDGCSDGEIADACRVKTSTITSYRLKRWRKNPDGGRDAPP